MNPMKSLIAVLVLAAAPMAMARDCVDANKNDISNQPEVFQAMIAKTGSCYEAAELARACAWGSSLDVRTAGIAIDICYAQMQKNQPTKQDTDLLSVMDERCSARYDGLNGTMYRSFGAYCRLSAIEFMTGIVTKEEVY